MLRAVIHYSQTVPNDGCVLVLRVWHSTTDLQLLPCDEAEEDQAPFARQSVISTYWILLVLCVCATVVGSVRLCSVLALCVCALAPLVADRRSAKVLCMSGLAAAFRGPLHRLSPNFIRF